MKRREFDILPRYPGELGKSRDHDVYTRPLLVVAPVGAHDRRDSPCRCSTL